MWFVGGGCVKECGRDPGYLLDAVSWFPPCEVMTVCYVDCDDLVKVNTGRQ